MPDGSLVIICGSRGRPKRCRWCLKSHTLLCDYIVGAKATCDAPMCQDHATETGPDTHICPDHVGD